MIKENDYEPIICEQPIYSHIYQNYDQFLFIYYTRLITNNKTKENIEEVEEITAKKPQNAQAQITFIETYLKNHSSKRKNMDNPTSFRKSKI